MATGAALNREPVHSRMVGRFIRRSAPPRTRGLLQVEAGIQWPDVIRAYLNRPGGMRSPWGIRQKQTGADRLTIGGAVAANIHGRGLTAPPFIIG